MRFKASLNPDVLLFVLFAKKVNAIAASAQA